MRGRVVYVRYGGYEVYEEIVVYLRYVRYEGELRDVVDDIYNHQKICKKFFAFFKNIAKPPSTTLNYPQLPHSHPFPTP